MPEHDVQRIAKAIGMLYDSYTPEGVGLWLVRYRTQVGGTPLGLLQQGKVDEFVDLCEGTGDMVAT